MTKLQTALLAFLFASLGSCDLVPTAALAFGHKAPPTPAVTPSPTPTPSSTPDFTVTTPDPTEEPSIEVGTVTGASSAEQAMIAQGVVLVNQVMAGACYKQWVLAARYTENLGLSQAEIWERIRTRPMRVDVEMYTGTWYENTVLKTVGYEVLPYDGVVHMNRHFVGTPKGVADNLAHEAEGHSQGFSHFQVKATSEPYGANYALEGCTAPQEMQRKGGKAYRPPGIRLRIVDRRRHARVFPKSHRHLTDHRCRDEHGRWIKGCR